MDGADRIADDDVAGGFFNNREGLQNGDAAADEGAEGAGEAGDGDLADHRADDRHLELEFVKNMAAELGANEQHEQDDEYGNPAGGIEDVVLDDLADGEDHAGEGRQLPAFQHAFEDLTERRNDLHHQDHEDAGGDDQHGDRVKHCGDNLAFDLLGLLHEFGEAIQDDFEDAAQLAGLDHVDEEAVEDLGVLGEAFGESAATFNGQGKVAKNGFEGGVPFLLFEHPQPPQQG